jgi:pimeloyl-ACP methyl ester carboxylesterase
VSANDPAASLLLVHGAGSGAWIYQDWPDSFPSLPVVAVDLQEGLDAGSASMGDYADRVVSRAHGLPEAVALCGWSMGGLVVLLAAQRMRPAGVILIEAGPPAEIQGFHADAEAVPGTFDPEAVYGPFPAGVRARPESSLARADRKRGISIPALLCPSLVIYGDDFREDRGKKIARLYRSLERDCPGLGHWGLIRDRRVRDAIWEFLAAEPAQSQGGER